MAKPICSRKMDAANPDARFDEREFASVKPKRGALLCARAVFLLLIALAVPAWAYDLRPYYRFDNSSPSQKRWGTGIGLEWNAWWETVRTAVDGSDKIPPYVLKNEGTFRVYRDGVLIAEVVDQGGYTDYDVVAGRTYSYMVTWDGCCSWEDAMERTCVESYEMTLDATDITVSPDVNWVTVGGILAHYTYEISRGILSSSSGTPSVKSIDCDWIQDALGTSAKKVLANATGAVREGHLTVGVRGCDICDQVVTVTQLPDAVSANGKDSYWDCHVAGLDWTDENAEFRALISFTNGVPSIGWYPALNGDRVKNGVRTYTVYGANAPGKDAVWNVVDEGREIDYRFFKVHVSMP